LTAQARSDVVARVRDAFARDDFDELGRIVTKYPLEFWFGMLPSEVHGVLAAVPPKTLRRNPVAAALLRMLAGAPLSGDLGVDLDQVVDGAPPRDVRQGIVFGQAVQARLAGDPVRAFATMRTLGTVAGAVPFFVDPSRGELTFALVQTGLSGMLAGRLSEALGFFEKSLVPTVPASLAFLNRDAHVRSAMIHVLYGDPRRATSHLEAARRVPRTVSWVEQILDTDQRMVEVMLQPRSEAAAGFDVLARVTVGQMHELWPFHVAALSQLAVAADRLEASRRRREEILAADVTHQPGLGLSGSIIPLCAAFESMLGGAVSTAQQVLAEADGRLWLTKLHLAMTAVGGGAHARGLRLARSIAAQTRGLPRVEVARMLVVALAQYGQGELSTTLATLREIEPWQIEFAAGLLGRFSPGLVAAAAEQLPGWEPMASMPGLAVAPLEQVQLSDRELEVLVALARGETREQIAAALFLSLNTVKTHLRSLYRKLGVASASEAILEGRRRGLV